MKTEQTASVTISIHITVTETMVYLLISYTMPTSDG